MNQKLNNWRFAFLLTLPVLAFVIIYFLKFQDTSVAPGFLQYDNVTYIAYTREYLDSDKISLFYSNPFNDSGNYPKIYFQVQNFIFLLLMETSIPPGYILIFFTWFFSFICFRIIISIFDHLLPESKNRLLSIVFFAWGGGLLALAGIASRPFIELDGLDLWDRIFILDPGWGWWGLNLGRSLLFSTEAYYHAIFFGAILCILKKKWMAALLLALLLSASHPFTGVEFLCIISAWSFVEIILKKNKSVPWWFGLASLAILVAHLCYYILFLNQFADHRSVHEQCSMKILLRYYNMLPAYFITGLLVILALWRVKSLRILFSDPINRLFACWFLVTFLLVNHEMFMPAMQPVHFTRGYVWSSLFLLGLPGLEWLLNYIRKKKYGLFFLSIFTVIFLSDNLLWMINYSRQNSQTHQSIYISREEQDVISWLHKNTDNSFLVIGANDNISLLNPVYTSSYSWASHNLATPFRSKKLEVYTDFILQSKLDSAWYDRNVVFILNRHDSLEAKRMNDLPFEPASITKIHHYVIITARVQRKN